MNDELSTWLRSLDLHQLDLVREKLDQLIEEKRKRVSNPGAASLNDLAASLGLDLTSLSRDIKRKTG